MAHVQKTDFAFWRKGRVHLNRRGGSVQSTAGSRVVSISDSNPGCNKFRGSVKGTGYPLHSPVSPSLPLPGSPCAITFQMESTTKYGRLRLKCDGTCAETSFRLSAKRTSPFKSAVASVQSTAGTAEVCASAVVMLGTPCSEVV